MKNLIISLALFISAFSISYSQNSEFEPSGKLFGKVFFNFHHDFTDNATQRNAFELQRAYLGYTYNYTDKISLKITFDAARRSAASSYTTFLKIAQLNWRVDNNVKLSMGLIGLKQFDTQEKFWGHRYLFKSFQDEFSLGSSADLGVNAEIDVAKNLKANLFVLNGEGYTNVQDINGRMKVGGNLIYTPVKELTLKGYFDVYGGDVTLENGAVVDTVSVKTFSVFAGYDAEKFRLGAEYTRQLDGKRFNQQAADHDLTGFSAYAIYNLNEKFELFLDYLHIESNTLEGEDMPWDYERDGNVIIGGIQYAPFNNIKMALNFREYLHNNAGNIPGMSSALDNNSALYLNMLYQF